MAMLYLNNQQEREYHKEAIILLEKARDLGNYSAKEYLADWQQMSSSRSPLTGFSQLGVSEKITYNVSATSNAEELKTFQMSLSENSLDRTDSHMDNSSLNYSNTNMGSKLLP
jgi:hypothetical protein